MGRSRIGVLVIPALGERRPVQAVASLVDGIGAALSDGGIDHSIETGGATVTLELGQRDRTVRFYPVEWRGRFADPATAGPFDTGYFAHVAWFPWLNWRGALTGGGLPAVAALSVWTAIALPLALVLWLGYRTAMLPVVLWRAMTRLRRSASSDGDARSEPASTVLDRALDRALGAGFDYAASSGGALGRQVPRFGAADESLTEVYQQMHNAVVDDGCEELHVVAHGLGAFVAFHAVTGYRLRTGEESAATYDPVAAISGLHTVGSPLAKVRYLWPRLIVDRQLGRITPGDDGLPARVDEPAPSPTFTWFDYRFVADPVAGSMRAFRHWKPVSRLVVAGGAARSARPHRRFLATLAAGLAEAEIGARRRPLRALAAAFASFGALLRAWGVVLAVAALGAAVAAAAAVVVPEAAAAVADGLGLDGAATQTSAWGWLVVLAIGLVSYGVLSHRRAAADHSRIWVTPPPGRGLPTRRR